MAEPTIKHPGIRDFQSAIMDKNVTASIQQDRCVSCGGPATEFTDELSKREFSISGLCQSCQDAVFTMDEEDLL